MGEKLKVINQVSLHDLNMDIELNAGTAKSNKRQSIHLQNDRFRLELSDKEYVQMAVAIHVAAENIKRVKEL